MFLVLSHTERPGEKGNRDSSISTDGRQENNTHRLPPLYKRHRTSPPSCPPPHHHRTRQSRSSSLRPRTPLHLPAAPQSAASAAFLKLGFAAAFAVLPPSPASSVLRARAGNASFRTSRVQSLLENAMRLFSFSGTILWSSSFYAISDQLMLW